MTQLLLRNGTVLVHNQRNEVDALHADVLVRAGVIEQIAPDITAVGKCETIDCTDKLISPGFVNTHYHAWSTQLKGLHANQTLLEFLPCGDMSSSFYRPDDVFWGQLAGMLETLNGGITTTLDFSTINYSPAHVAAAIQASNASGMRSIYAYTPTPRAKFSEEGKMEMLPVLESWVMEAFEKLASAQLGIRTRLGFAFDGLHLPQSILKPLFQQVHAKQSVHVITMHDNIPAWLGGAPSVYRDLVEKDLLDPENETHWVLAHSNKLDAEPVADLQRNKIFASITPASELSMGLGAPVPIALNREQDALANQVSVGIDCHSIGESFLPGQLRSQLFAARQYTHATAAAQNHWYASMDPRKGRFAGVLDAFNLATINGARALGMENEIGRLKPGFKADLIIWDKLSPSMLAAAEEDPVAAIIIHAQSADVSGVIVDGIVRKLNGTLLPVQVDAAPSDGPLAEYHAPVHGSVNWSEIATEVLRSRNGIIGKVKKIDQPAACACVIDAFQLYKEGMLDPIK